MSRITKAIRRQQSVLAAAVITRLGGDRDRGDVPGWVLITLMTAGIVTVLWQFAGDQLLNMFRDAIGSVDGPKGR